MINPVQIRDGKVYYDGEEVQIFCRWSPKFLAYLSKGQLDLMLDWIEFNKALGFNTLEVYGELMQPPVGLERPPGLKGIWPIQQMLNGNRVEDVNDKNKGLLEELYKVSSYTGMAFIYTINCTLKDIMGMSSGMIGHAISRLLEHCRGLAAVFPKAKIIFNFHNGWNTAWNANAPDQQRVKLGLWELGQQAGRCRRWVKVEGNKKMTKMSFEKPGPNWEPEQYPEAAIMCEEDFGSVRYPVGTDVKEFPITALRVNTFKQFGVGNRHRPVYLSKTPAVTDENLEEFTTYMETMRRRGFHFFVQDEKSRMTDPRIEQTRFETYLLGEPEPEPEPEPDPEESLLQKIFRILEEWLFGKKE